jgi:hypothetical protein
MDQAYYDDLAGRLMGALITLEDRLPPPDRRVVAEYLDYAEYGLALEHLAWATSEAKIPIRADEREQMLSIARVMGIESSVAATLGGKPEEG